MTTSEPPRWLCVLALVPAVGVLSLGSVGLLLAVNGQYRPALAFPLGIIVWVAMLALVSPLFRAPAPIATPGTGRIHVFAAVGVVAIVAIATWNMAHASQHVLIDRDGGSYSNTARWIARDGSLSVKPGVGPFAHEPTVGFASNAVYSQPDGTLQFQFAHLLPVVLAESYAVAGDTGLFHTPELLGGIAMLAFFVLAWRLLRRPLFALAAMLALALTIPEVSFARDSYSEIPSQILLFTALWLLVTPRVLPRWRIALAAGIFLGALEATRIDALVFLIGVPVIAVVAWLRREASDRRATLASIAAFAAGLVPGMLLGLVDLTRHSGGYWTSLRGEIGMLGAAATTSLVVCMIVVGVWRFVFPFGRKLPWNTLSSVAGALVVLTGFVVWAFRPHVQHLRGNAASVLDLQRAEHLPVDATRPYFERSMTWMSWYLGPLTIAFAIVGAGLLLRALLRGQKLRTMSAVAVLVPGSLLYLYRAYAIPDHVWVTRRFLVSAIPALVLLGFGLAAHLSTSRATNSWGRLSRGGAVVFAVVGVAYPVYTLIPIRAMAEETGYLALVHDACDTIGPRAAVVMLEARRTDQVDDWFPQALRSWCGAEVAVTRGLAQPDALRRLARSWSAEGRPMFVVGPSVDDLRRVLPEAQVKADLHAADDHLLAPTLSHRPDKYRTQSFELVIAGIPPS